MTVIKSEEAAIIVKLTISILSFVAKYSSLKSLSCSINSFIGIIRMNKYIIQLRFMPYLYKGIFFRYTAIELILFISLYPCGEEYTEPF